MYVLCAQLSPQAYIQRMLAQLFGGQHLAVTYSHVGEETFFPFWP